MRALPLLVLSLAGLLGGCATRHAATPAPPASAFGETEAVPDGPIRAADFPRADAILTGFDVRPVGDAPPGWRTGDRMLVGVRLEDGAEARTWYVELEVEPVVERDASDHAPASRRTHTLALGGAERRVTLTSDVRNYAIRVHDADGRLVAASSAPVAFRHLETGMFDACVAALRADDETAPVAARLVAKETVLRGFHSMVTTLEALGAGHALDEVRSAARDTVLRPPSAGSLLNALFRGTLSIGLEPDFAAAAADLDASVVPGWMAPVRRLPLRAETGGRAAVETVLYVTPPAPPVHLSGGIIGVDARHPDDSRRRLRAVVLAARRGPAPPERTPQADASSARRVASARIVGVPKTQ